MPSAWEPGLAGGEAEINEHFGPGTRLVSPLCRDGAGEMKPARPPGFAPGRTGGTRDEFIADGLGERDRLVRGMPGRDGERRASPVHGRFDPFGDEAIKQSIELARHGRHLMWMFITNRFRQWLLLAVAVPLALWILSLIRRRLEARSGSTRLTRAMARGESLGRRARHDLS